MIEFIDTLADKPLREKLSSVTRGKGAFRRFKDTLAQYPEIQKQWYDFKQDRLNQEVIDWLTSIGIQPIKVDAKG